MAMYVFKLINIRDVDAIKERIACDLWHRQGYKNILAKKDKKL